MVKFEVLISTVLFVFWKDIETAKLRYVSRIAEIKSYQLGLESVKA